VIATTVGSLALGDLKRRQGLGEPAQLPSDLGELSITNFVISPRAPGVNLVMAGWVGGSSSHRQCRRGQKANSICSTELSS
jgi:hypothetical protein